MEDTVKNIKGGDDTGEVRWSWKSLAICSGLTQSTQVCCSLHLHQVTFPIRRLGLPLDDRSFINLRRSFLVTPWRPCMVDSRTWRLVRAIQSIGLFYRYTQ